MNSNVCLMFSSAQKGVKTYSKSNPTLTYIHYISLRDLWTRKSVQNRTVQPNFSIAVISG